jgi:hypothetical protein
VLAMLEVQVNVVLDEVPPKTVFATLPNDRLTVRENCT